MRCGGRRPPASASTPSSPTCPRPCAGAAASAGSRGSSACTPATRATASATTRSAPRGDHANTLHWIKNTGDVAEGDLLLLDAGVEVDSLFTADITRTLPVSGTFTDAQRKVYDAVYAAQEAGHRGGPAGQHGSPTSTRPRSGSSPSTCTRWGLLPEGVDVEGTLDAEHGQYHRRWMVHGTSHHLGIDVHDCALATREQYSDAVLEPGMVLTVEPGLYFKADDELVPGAARHRGPHRGRHARHRGRLREPVGRDAAHQRRTSRRGSPGPGRPTAELRPLT